MFRYNYMTGKSHVEKCDSTAEADADGVGGTHYRVKAGFDDETVCVTKTNAGNYDQDQEPYNPRRCNNLAQIDTTTFGDYSNITAADMNLGPQAQSGAVTKYF